MPRQPKGSTSPKHIEIVGSGRTLADRESAPASYPHLMNQMTAIVITRLRMQLAALVDLYQQPKRFVRELHDLLEFYTDHAFRPAQSIRVDPLVPHYHVPIQVVRFPDRSLFRKDGTDHHLLSCEIR